MVGIALYNPREKKCNKKLGTSNKKVSAKKKKMVNTEYSSKSNNILLEERMDVPSGPQCIFLQTANTPGRY